MRPSAKELNYRLAEIWKEHYPDRIEPLGRIEISNRLRSSAGIVYQRSFGFLLRLSGRYHDQFGWGPELDATMRHEVIHIANPRVGHGFTFQKEMHRVGATRYCRNRNATPVETVYECCGCEHLFTTKDHIECCPECGCGLKVRGTIEI